MKLDPQDLVVTSFETDTDAFDVTTTIDNPTDPTPATACRWCPDETIGCM